MARSCISAGFVYLLVFFSSLVKAEHLISDMTVFEVKENDGQEQFVQADEVKPDSILEYRLSYTNRAAVALNVQDILTPIPLGTNYVSGSSSADTVSQFHVSDDKKKNWRKENFTRKVKNNKGQWENQIVPPSEYTHLRWSEVEKFQPGEKKVFKYRVRVL